MLYNLHTHTFRCNHATGEDKAYVEYAIQSGVKVLGFSDHCPQFFKKPNYYSHFRMRPIFAEKYAQSVRDLAEEYKDDIKILLGFETEYYPETYDELIKTIRDLDTDYLILGEHLIGNEYDEEQFYTGERGGDDYLKKYTDQVIEGLEKGVFTYLCHPDLVNHKGSEEVYIKEMTRLCEKAKELNIPLEYNMLGKYYGRNYPNKVFWNIAKKVGNTAVIGFDAHTPTFMLKTDLRDECVNELNKLGIKLLDFGEINIIKP